MKKIFFKKEDKGFYIANILCIIFFLKAFLNPDLLKEFKGLGLFLWIIIPFLSYFSGMLLSFFLFLFFMLIKSYISQVKEALIEKDYWILFAITFGVILFILIIRPILKTIIMLIVYVLFDTKLNIY